MKIRSVLEFAAPVFTSMLSQKNKSDIERIQKIVFRILLSDNYISYTQACVSFNTTSLEQRREHLSLKFALSCLENPQHKNLFKQRKTTFYNLRDIKSFEVPFCNTTRYYNSPLPYLTRLLNEYFKHKPGKQKALKCIKQ